MAEDNKVVIFKTGNEEYAIPISYVVSIEKAEEVTHIPKLPETVLGMIEVRGDLIPVIDLEKVLYSRTMEADETTRLIVLKLEGFSLGMMVNDAKEIIDIPEEKIKQVGLISYHQTAYISGIANLEGRLITLIQPEILAESLDGIKEIKEYLKNRQ